MAKRKMTPIPAENIARQILDAYKPQMEGITEVRPNISTHPEYGQAVVEAKKAGVEFMYLQTKVEKGELRIV